MTIPNILSTLQERLEKGIETHQVPGASLAVLYKDDVYAAAAGVLNIDTGVDVTEDAIFQIGSITKIFTTTLVMQLVDEGKIDLDEPVKKYLPEFKVADPEATETVTVRQLLCHTSGIEGDYFEEADYGRDKLARYMEKCTLLPQLHAPGKYIAYCNSGFSFLGRLVEVMTGRTWEEAMGERIITPLGMQRAVVRAEETLKYRTAIGHVPLPEKDQTEDKKMMISPMPYLQLAAAPAGSTTTMPSIDLLKFANLHLSKGKAADGKIILSEASVNAMQEKQFAAPRHAALNVTHWGLGWMLMDWDGHRVIGHDGGTIGQLAFLRIIPDQHIAVALLTNSMNGGKLYKELFADIISQLAGVTMPPDPQPVEMEMDLNRYVGRYENIAGIMEVYLENGYLKARSSSKIFAEIQPPLTFDLKPVDHDCFQGASEGDTPPVVISFLGDTGDGKPLYVFSGFRQFRRMG